MPPFYRASLEAQGSPAHRSSARVIREIRARIAELPLEARSFETIQGLAATFKVNGQFAWKIARAFGAPVRNARRNPRKLSEADGQAIFARYNAGESPQALSAEFQVALNTIMHRIRLLDEALDDAAELEQLRGPRLGPRIYQPLSFPALSLEQLAIGKARAAKSGLAPIPTPAP